MDDRDDPLNYKGETFDSAKKMDDFFKKIHKETGYQISHGTSSTIKKQKNPSLYKAELVYVWLNLKCHSSGEFVEKKNPERIRGSIKTNCPVSLKVRLTNNRSQLIISDASGQHNHPPFLTNEQAAEIRKNQARQAAANIAGAEQIVAGDEDDEIDNRNEEIVDGDEAIVVGDGKIFDGNEEIVDGDEAIVIGDGKIFDGDEEIVDGDEAIVIGDGKIFDGDEEIVDRDEEIVDGDEAIVYENKDIVDKTEKIVAFEVTSEINVIDETATKTDETLLKINKTLDENNENSFINNLVNEVSCNVEFASLSIVEEYLNEIKGNDNFLDIIKITNDELVNESFNCIENNILHLEDNVGKNNFSQINRLDTNRQEKIVPKMGSREHSDVENEMKDQISMITVLGFGSKNKLKKKRSRAIRYWTMPRIIPKIIKKRNKKTKVNKDIKKLLEIINIKGDKTDVMINIESFLSSKKKINANNELTKNVLSKTSEFIDLNEKANTQNEKPSEILEQEKHNNDLDNINSQLTEIKLPEKLKVTGRPSGAFKSTTGFYPRKIKKTPEESNCDTNKVLVDKNLNINKAIIPERQKESLQNIVQNKIAVNEDAVESKTSRAKVIYSPMNKENLSKKNDENESLYKIQNEKIQDSEPNKISTNNKNKSNEVLNIKTVDIKVNLYNLDKRTNFIELLPCKQIKYILSLLLIDKKRIEQIYNKEILLDKDDLVVNYKLKKDYIPDPVLYIDMTLLQEVCTEKGKEFLEKKIKEKKDLKIWPCHHCGKKLRSGNYIQCDCCLFWFNNRCMRLAEDYHEKYWFCTSCQ